MSNNTNWFDKAKPASALVHIERFLDENIFATEEGGYGLVLRLDGVDAECLSDETLASRNGEMLQALRSLPESVSLFQTFIKKRAGDIAASRFVKDSPSPEVRRTAAARHKFLASRNLFSVSLFWTLYAKPPKLSKKEKKRAGANQFERNSAKMLRELRTAAANLVSTLSVFGARMLKAQDIARFYAYLCNLDDSRFHTLRSPNRMSRQITNSAITWHDEGLAVNRGTTEERFVQPFSLIQPPSTTRPNLFTEIARIPAEIVVTLECRRKSSADTRAEVRAHENFMEFFKHNIFVRMAHRKKEVPKTAAAVASDAALDIGGLGGVINDVANLLMNYFTFSIIGFVHSHNASDLRDQVAAVHRAFGRSEAILMNEGLGALSAFQAMFPGAVNETGSSLNVRRLWVREDHLARMSFGYSPFSGSPRSETLEDESLAIFETRDQTVYHFDQFGSGPRGGLAIGEPRRGKTFTLSFLVDSEAKYGGYVFIYDVGGSYENVILKYGGTVVKVGLSGPRFNPFSLENTPANRNETARLVIMLLQRSGAQLRPQDETGIRESVAAIYELENPSLRRLKFLILAPALQPYLSKWTQGGIYAGIFDNADDDLRLARMISFDFEGLNKQDQEVLMQPLLFWIRLRIGSLVRAEGNLALPKLEIYDEVWRLIQDPTILAGIFDSMKTYGKKLGGIYLATQDPKDLGPHAGVIRNACPDAFFLGGAFDRQQLVDLFELNENQIDLISTLQLGEMLMLRSNHSKVIRLAVDDESKWVYSTHPQDVRRRTEAIRLHGREAAFNVLATTVAAK